MRAGTKNRAVIIKASWSSGWQMQCPGGGVPDYWLGPARAGKNWKIEPDNQINQDALLHQLPRQGNVLKSDCRCRHPKRKRTWRDPTIETRKIWKTQIHRAGSRQVPPHNNLSVGHPRAQPVFPAVLERFRSSLRPKSSASICTV